VVIVGALALVRHERGADVQSDDDYAHPGPAGSPPALTFDLAGWQVRSASEDDFPAAPDAVRPRAGEAVQVFRQPDDLVGPTVYVSHHSSSDAVVPQTGSAPVQINGAAGAITEPDAQHVSLHWNPTAASDSTIDLDAWKLSRNEAIDFASALELKDNRISYPATGNDHFGVRATTPGPKDIEEDPIDPIAPGPWKDRNVDLNRPNTDDYVHIAISSDNEQLFEDVLHGFVGSSKAEVVSVLGHSAVLLRSAPNPEVWTLVWRQPGRALVSLNATGVDRSTMEDIIGGLKELSDAEWQDMLLRYPQ